MKKILLLICLLAQPCSHAGSEFGLTGYDLLDLCESDKDSDKAVCAYYIAGISGGVAQANIESGTDSKHCLPVSIKLHHLPGFYVSYSEKKPELLEHPSDSLIYVMLKEYFPCQVLSD